MDDDRNRSSAAGPILTVVALLVFVPVLYILSCGPAVALMTRGYLSEKVFHIIYFPLGFTAQLSPWLGNLLESYAELWAA